MYVAMGVGAEHCTAQNVAVPWEVSAELLTLVPAKKQRREREA